MLKNIHTVVFYVPDDQGASAFVFLDDCKRLSRIDDFKMIKGCEVINSPPQQNTPVVRFAVELDSAERCKSFLANLTSFLNNLIKRSLMPEGWPIQVENPAN